MMMMMMMTAMGAGNLSRSRVRNARIDRRDNANRTSLHLWAFTSRARARVVTTARMNESMRIEYNSRDRGISSRVVRVLARFERPRGRGRASMGDSNTAVTIVLTVTMVVVGFLAVNVILFERARRRFGEPKPKKRLGAKQKKRLLMKRSLRAGGD